MNDCSLITAISGIACAIIKNCSEDEITLLSVIFTQLGDTLATYLTQQDLCNSRRTAKEDNQSNNNINNNNSNDNKDTKNDDNKESPENGDERANTKDNRDVGHVNCKNFDKENYKDNKNNDNSKAKNNDNNKDCN